MPIDQLPHWLRSRLVRPHRGETKRPQKKKPAALENEVSHGPHTKNFQLLQK
jgi:hypothetical protein